MENKKYYQEINIARGLVVLCVLFGHSFPDAQTGISLPSAQWLHDLMYSFHMGCFFILAGFVSGSKLRACKGNLQLEIGKKFKRLIVPYLFYSIITMGLKQVFSAFANNQFDVSEIWKILIGKNPNGGMWYLWTLFIISIVFLLINQVSRSAIVYIMVGIVMYAVYIFLPSTFLDNVFGYAIFYSIGIILQTKYESIEKIFNSKIGLISAIISGIIFIGLVTFEASIYLVTCLLASYSVLTLSYFFAKKKDSSTYAVLTELGRYSYDVYLLSYFVQIPIRVIFYRIFPMPYWIVVAMMFVLGTIIPYILSKYVVRKISITNKILLGNWN